MKELQVGDRVYVTDPALAAMRDIMRRATGTEPKPNHYGIVASVDGDRVLVTFDDGMAAPYSASDVRPLDGASETDG